METQACKLALVRALVVAAATLSFCTPAQGAPKYQVLHAFGNGNDGAGLWSSVTLDKEGRLYGATSAGGQYNNGGTVFRLTPQSNGDWTEAILHSFPFSSDDGAAPNGGLVQDSAGNWYGTTKDGGTDYTAGTVFKLTHGTGGWAEAILYSFGTQHGDEGQPTAGLVMDSLGNLYGTTKTTAFELIPGREPDSWSEKILHRFCSWSNCSDGAGSYAGLILDASSNLYGTTYGGGPTTAARCTSSNTSPPDGRRACCTASPSITQTGTLRAGEHW